MAYTVVNKLIPSTSHKLKSPHAMVPQYITIHNTYNDASALNEVAYMARNMSATSFHVAVDDKHVIQAIPFNRNAWHCGDGQGTGNRKSIGVEICYSKSGGQRYADAEENAVEYVARLLKQYGWGIDRVKWHRDWSGKNCPHRILGEGRAQSFKDRIAHRLKELIEEVSTAATEKKENDLYKPSNEELVRATSVVLGRLERKPNDPISNQWRQKLVDGTLTNSDAIGILFTAIERGHVVGKG